MYTAAAVYLFYLATSAAVVVLRFRDPQTKRPYRATGFPVTTVVFCLVCVFLIVAAVDYRPIMAAASLAVILLGVPAYWLSERIRVADTASAAAPAVPAFWSAVMPMRPGGPASHHRRGRSLVD